MSVNGSWLCPGELDRSRLLDMEHRLRRSLPVVYGSVALTFIASVPWTGLWPIVALAVILVHYRLLRTPIANSERPEYWLAWLFLFRQLIGGATVALTGGLRAR
jgi:hypothetical protein